MGAKVGGSVDLRRKVRSRQERENRVDKAAAAAFGAGRLAEGGCDQRVCLPERDCAARLKRTYICISACLGRSVPSSFRSSRLGHEAFCGSRASRLSCLSNGVYSFDLSFGAATGVRRPERQAVFAGRNSRPFHLRSGLLMHGLEDCSESLLSIVSFGGERGSSLHMTMLTNHVCASRDTETWTCSRCYCHVLFCGLRRLLLLLEQMACPCITRRYCRITAGCQDSLSGYNDRCFTILNFPGCRERQPGKGMIGKPQV
jgi:hypothetical protein